MENRLTFLIRAFRNTQDAAVELLRSHLDIPQPESGRAWAYYCRDNHLHQIRELKGVAFYAHGFGVEISVNEQTIDFDWGDGGEADGFDTWRLFNFARNNLKHLHYTHEEVEVLMSHALSEGEIIQKGSLFYDPSNRNYTS